MSETLLALIVVLGVAVLVALAGLAWWRSTLVQREKRRIDVETRLAEWQLQAVARTAMLQMLDAARQHARPDGR